MGGSLRILFINPKSTNLDALPIPPLGILYLASYIMNKGYKSVKVIDNNQKDLSVDSLAEDIKASDIIALTGTTSQLKQAREIAAISKECGKIVVYGGPHATPLAEETLKNANVDIVVIGEGEVTFYELLEAIKTGKDLSDIEGIVFKKDGTVKRNKERPFIRDLDQLPFPDRELVSMDAYPTRELKRFSGRYTHIMSSRGCSGKCIFCSSPMMWKYPRVRSAENVFEEMMEVYNRYKIKNIHFQDDAFTINRKRVQELCGFITESKIDFKWSCQARPDNIDYDLAKAMVGAGCVQIEFGIESGDPLLLDKAQKGYTKDKISNAFRFAKEAGIATYGFFLIGLPGETLSSWIRSIIFAKSLKMDSCVWTVLAPFPGTRVFEERMVDIIEPDYSEWRYKNPVIRSGRFGPKALLAMRRIADIVCNGPFNTGAYKIAKACGHGV